MLSASKTTSQSPGEARALAVSEADGIALQLKKAGLDRHASSVSIAAAGLRLCAPTGQD